MRRAEQLRIPAQIALAALLVAAGPANHFGPATVEEVAAIARLAFTEYPAARGQLDPLLNL